MKKIMGLMFLIMGLMIVIRPVKAKAGCFENEALGGWSYILDCAYEHKPLKEPYRSLMYEWYMRYHYEYNVTEEERAILERIVEAEATGGNVEQKMNVASCVIARMESKSWPNTIEGVVFQKQQFTPIWDGRYYKVKITDTTKQAVDKVLKNGKTHNCMWFCSDKSYKKKNEQGEYISYHRLNHEWAFYDGEHHYFY